MSKFHNGSDVKESAYNAGDIRDAGSILDGEDTLEEEMQSTLGFLPGKSNGQRSLVGYNPKNWI